MDGPDSVCYQDNWPRPGVIDNNKQRQVRVRTLPRVRYVDRSGIIHIRSVYEQLDILDDQYTFRPATRVLLTAEV